MLVISDTSPLRALNHLGLVELLKNLFGEVAIPPAVADELKSPPARFISVELSQFEFIRMVSPKDTQSIFSREPDLDVGEVPQLEWEFRSSVCSASSSRSNAAG
jgi:predicted nucleic acid-binding protein